MQKWEYLFLAVDREKGILSAAGRWKVRFINAKEIPDWEGGPDLAEYCNHLGDQGWELVTLSQAPTNAEGASTIRQENFRLVLKRPRE